jgi:hypothetical protein
MGVNEPMRVRAFVITAVVSSFVFLTAASPIAAKKLSKPQPEDDIREAVLRYQMNGWTYYHVFFIGIDKRDPSDDFMRRFEKYRVAVKKLSDSEFDEKTGNAVVDKTTHEKGIQFYVGKMEWRGPNFVEVEGGYFCNGLCAAAVTFKVQRKNGIWTVESSKVNAIS